MFYWLCKHILIGPWLKLIFRPSVEGLEHLPADGPAILSSCVGTSSIAGRRYHSLTKIVSSLGVTETVSPAPTMFLFQTSWFPE